jgi:type II secretory pathway pseudopilin PulG
MDTPAFIVIGVVGYVVAQFVFPTIKKAIERRAAEVKRQIILNEEQVRKQAQAEEYAAKQLASKKKNFAVRFPAAGEGWDLIDMGGKEAWYNSATGEILEPGIPVAA